LDQIGLLGSTSRHGSLSFASVDGIQVHGAFEQLRLQDSFSLAHVIHWCKNAESARFHVVGSRRHVLQKGWGNTTLVAIAQKHDGPHVDVCGTLSNHACQSQTLSKLLKRSDPFCPQKRRRSNRSHRHSMVPVLATIAEKALVASVEILNKRDRQTDRQMKKSKSIKSKK
jgi:hypothetical protein